MVILRSYKVCDLLNWSMCVRRGNKMQGQTVAKQKGAFVVAMVVGLSSPRPMHTKSHHHSLATNRTILCDRHNAPTKHIYSRLLVSSLLVCFGYECVCVQAKSRATTRFLLRSDNERPYQIDKALTQIDTLLSRGATFHNECPSKIPILDFAVIRAAKREELLLLETDSTLRIKDWRHCVLLDCGHVGVFCKWARESTGAEWQDLVWTDVTKEATHDWRARTEKERSRSTVKDLMASFG